MEMENLEDDLYEKDNNLKQKKLLILRAEYDKISTDESAKSLMWLKQDYHDHSKKAEKPLAWTIKKHKTDWTINSISALHRNLTTDLLDINICFNDFYESLYRSECNQDSDAQETFLYGLQFQSFSDNIKKWIR